MILLKVVIVLVNVKIEERKFVEVFLYNYKTSNVEGILKRKSTDPRLTIC